MYYALCSRERLYPLLPRQGVGCELGVYRGDNAESLLRLADPHTLHLVDAWKMGSAESLIANSGFSPESLCQWREHRIAVEPGIEADDIDAFLEACYKHTLARFASESCVQIHRARSADSAARFADLSLDWVYVDADHCFDRALEDLRCFEEKLKPDGVFILNDHMRSALAEHSQYGVVEAASAFMVKTDFVPLALTHGEFPDLVIARRDSPICSRFKAGLVAAGVPLIELPDALVSNFRSLYFELEEGGRRWVPAF